MKHDFDFLPNRRQTESAKWFRYGPDVLPLWVADMDFLSPPAVLQALHQRIEHGVLGYAIQMPELIEAVITRLEHLYSWKVSPEDLMLVPGVVTGFNLACHAFAKPDGAALIQTPVYPPFFRAPSNAGIERQEAALTLEADGSYSIDFDAFEAAITDQTRLFILCNPHNPVGRVFRQDELMKIAEICLRHKVLICSDEIHAELIFSGQKHIPIAALDKEIASQTITLIAPSKTFNIAGLDCSVAIIQNPSLREKFLSARQGLVPSVNLLGQVAANAAYRHGQDWLDNLLVYLESNRDYLDAYLKENLPGIKMWKPEGTFLAWLNCQELDLKVSPYEFFLENAKVALNDGHSFGKGGEDFVRLNFGCPRSMLQEALERMRAAVTENRP